jgi:DNA-directed RNA polymerase specialized sigma24 family protein
VKTASGVVDRTDRQLAELALGGDLDAWGALVDRYSPYVHAIAVRAFGLGESDADEVFQGVFHRLFADLGVIRGDFRGPIGVATRSLCLERRTDAAVDPGTAALLLQIEAAMNVRGALGLLDESRGDLLRRFFVSNQSYRTIAEELELPITTLPGRVASALDELCDLMAAEGIDR